MAFSSGLKDVITRESQEGKSRAPAGAPFLTQTINVEVVDWKALPDGIRPYQTGRRAELADLLLLLREALETRGDDGSQL